MRALLVTYGSLLVVWQLAGDAEVLNRQLLPTPTDIAWALFELTLSGGLLVDIFASLRRVIVGFLIAGTIGICLAFAMAINIQLSRLVSPTVELVRPIPPIAWIPVAILWFGIGDGSAYFVVAIGTFFPIFTNTFFGIKSLNKRYKLAALSLGAAKRNYVVDILLPSSLPAIFTGLKLGLGVGWMSVVAAELIGAQSGLGYMIQFNRLLLETPRVVAGMMVIGLLGFAMSRAMSFADQRLLEWSK